MGDRDGGANLQPRSWYVVLASLSPRLAWVVLLAFYSSFSVEQNGCGGVPQCEVKAQVCGRRLWLSPELNDSS